MAPAQKSDSKESKSSTNRNDVSDTPGNGRGAGLWIFFPLVTVVIGIVVGLLMNAEPEKQAASETPAAKKGELYYPLLVVNNYCYRASWCPHLARNTWYP